MFSEYFIVSSILISGAVLGYAEGAKYISTLYGCIGLIVLTVRAYNARGQS
jgi:uncharacterized membrane protein